jgi:hypothetical protein
MSMEEVAKPHPSGSELESVSSNSPLNIWLPIFLQLASICSVVAVSPARRRPAIIASLSAGDNEDGCGARSAGSKVALIVFVPTVELIPENAGVPPPENPLYAP